MSDLKPCPFCGHAGITIDSGSTFRWRLPACDFCGATCGEVRVQTLGEGDKAQWEAESRVRAIEAWNTRAAAPVVVLPSKEVITAIVSLPGGIEGSPIVEIARKATRIYIECVIGAIRKLNPNVTFRADDE